MGKFKFSIERHNNSIINSKKNPNPLLQVKKIILAYNFETIQNIKFEIRDPDMKHHDFLGRYETTLATLVAGYGRQTIGKLVGKIEGATIRDFGEMVIKIINLEIKKFTFHPTIHSRLLLLRKSHRVNSSLNFNSLPKICQR